jgi:hypothetical protein
MDDHGGGVGIEPGLGHAREIDPDMHGQLRNDPHEIGQLQVARRVLWIGFHQGLLRAEASGQGAAKAGGDRHGRHRRQACRTNTDEWLTSLCSGRGATAVSTRYVNTMLRPDRYAYGRTCVMAGQQDRSSVIDRRPQPDQ